MTIPYFIPKRVLKRIPLALRQEFIGEVLRRTKCYVSIDWSRVSTNKVEAILDAFTTLKPDELDRIKYPLYWINQVGAQKDLAAFIALQFQYYSKPLPEDFATATQTAKAVYAYTMLPDGAWENICAISQITKHPSKQWTTLEYDSEGELIPDTLEAALLALKDGVCEYTKETELRGEHGKCKYYPREELNQDCYVLYMNDHPLNRVHWLGADNFKDSISNEAFEVDVIYDRATKRVHIHADGTPEMRKKIAIIWAQTILHLPEVKFKDKASYRIQHFKEYQTDAIPLQPGSAILTARVSGLYADILDSPGSRRAYEEKTDDLFVKVRKELNAGVLSLMDMHVRRVRIDMSYRAPTGETRTTTLNITPKSTNILSLPEDEQKLVSDFLVEQGIIDAA